MKPVTPAVCLIVSATLLSCSVLEDRRECPGNLNLSIDKMQDHRSALIQKPVFVTVRGIGEQRGFRSVFMPSEYPDGFGMVVPKDSYMVSLVSGADTGLQYPELVGTLFGQEADSLFVSCQRADCLEEETYLSALLFKQFATLTLNLSNIPEQSDPELYIYSNWNGTRLFSQEPVQGKFMARMRNIAQSSFQIRLPRQGGGPLEVVIHEKGQSEPYVEYDISDAIREKGFDWNARSLGDMTLTLDYARGIVESLEISNWEELTFETEI